MVVSEELMKEINWKNSKLHFLYRQFCIAPPPLPNTLSLVGQTAIITGSNNGLGIEASLQLLQHGLSHLILAVRSISKGESAKERFLSAIGKGQTLPEVEYEALKAQDPSAKPPVLSIVGNETAGWASFKAADLAIKNKTSILSMLNDKEHLDMGDAYQISKLLALCFIRSFCTYLASEPKICNDVIINNVNPGFCYGTELHSDVPVVIRVIVKALARTTGRTPSVGARTFAHAGAVAGVESHGRYLSDCAVEVFFPFLETEKGMLVQDQLWEELRNELGKVVDFEQALSQGL
ncbi:hypothetical protein BP5796_06520 [Coleophoma crateriformis]|uniref:NAD(P)-binding protein n=1 Tax=Coleophoma crateriformis TaxID=565419 RepID=A0A3D8RNS2_9HELO|nr:hypothetical protein BP5796_06520 [Coleophoma crateriformis]